MDEEAHEESQPAMSYRRLQAKVLANQRLFTGVSRRRARTTRFFGEGDFRYVRVRAPPESGGRSSIWTATCQRITLSSRLLRRECEALERNEPTPSTRKSMPESHAKRPRPTKAKDRKERSRQKVRRASTATEHGWGNHDSASCWTLHPKLKPAKFQDFR